MKNKLLIDIGLKIIIYSQNKEYVESTENE